MKRYESYKDSGVKWLGEIPGHWEVIRLKALLIERIEKNNNKENLIILSLLKDKGIIPYDEKGAIGNNSKEDLSQYKIARKGDLVINSMNVIIGSVGITQYDGYISPAYYSFKPKGIINLIYYYYLMTLRSVQQSIRCYSKGIMEIRLRITSNDFLSMPFPFPPKSEQTAIANYLDSVTSKIDEAISQQQKMIDLLNERKQIIIQNAVTKGLDPNAKMKDSGVEWIGEIPEDWEVKRMRYIGDAQNGLTYSPSDIVEQSNGILVLRSSNIENGRLVFKDNVYVKKCNPKFYVKKGDIIICSRNGSASLVGKCAIVDNEIDASFGAFMMRFRSYNHNKYIYYLLTSAISHYKQLFSTSTINQLTLSIFANIKMPICSHYIQKDIADYLDDKTSKIDSYISQCNKMISLLQERKQIIINDVVTGKVKVI